VTLLNLLSSDRSLWEDTARRWIDLNLPNTFDFARAGVTPEDALRLKEARLHDEVLSQELSLRLSERPPIDPYLAMHFNHLVFIAFGPDSNSLSLPFWARHVPDLHD